MPSVILNKISEPKSLTDEYLNTTPFSFTEWFSRHTGISFNDAEKQYEKYLKDFYKENSKKTNNLNNKIKEDYLELIRRLQIIFQNDIEFERYKNIDLNSKTELSIAIPFYAKKLKEIAQFYLRKRKELQSKKVEYNLVGSFEGLSKILHNKISSKFTRNEQNNFVHDNPLITQSPLYSSISEDFSIEIQELYDTTDYYSLEENINPLTCAFNKLCYSIFATPLSAKSDPLETLYLCDPSNENVNELLQKAYQKYLSTDVYFISGGYFTEKYINFTIPFEQGNNFFYWFSGQTTYDIPEGLYKDANIHSYDWSHATGSSSIDTSDIIFVNAGNILNKSAWLYKTDYITVTATMSATIHDGKIFKFPFCYYGTSAFHGKWSGPGINDTILPDKKFYFSEEDYQQTKNNIIDTYWNSFSSISSVKSILLQDTNLSNVATPSNKFNNADKIYITPKNDFSGYYSGNKYIAWLYQFNETQIPITIGENKIYFPLQKYDDESEIFFNYHKNISLELSSFDVSECFKGSVAGLNVDESDLIVKKLTICGPEIEAAWLKSVPLSYYTNKQKNKCDCDPNILSYFTGWSYISGGTQSTLSFKCSPSNHVRFLWTGETININDVRDFTGFDHDDSCEYKRLDHSISILDKNFYNSTNSEILEKWKKCTCGAIHRSPIGHKNQDFESLGVIPDFIVRDVGYPFDFYFKDWRGSDGKNYTQSKDSARFYSNFIEKDIGWGKGQWKSQNGEDFILEKGQSYIFYRAVSNNCSFESPYFIINHSYNKGTIPDYNCNPVSYYPVWYKAVKNADGDWIDAGIISDMKLNFGDFISYFHKEQHSRTISRLLYNGSEVNSISGDYIYFNEPSTNISYQTYNSSIPSVNFVITMPIGNNSYWSKAEYMSDTSKKYTINDFQFNKVYDYLQITQPPPSDIILNDQDVIEFSFTNCSSGCYIWKQDLTFNVYNPIRKWNKILTDSCSESEILNYLNKHITFCNTVQKTCDSDCSYMIKCPCIIDCNSTKMSLTATMEDSDINFNTEVSGSYMFINYFARNNFYQKLSVLDITDGDKSLFVPIYSSQYIKPETPWRDLLNQNGSNFVTKEITDNLQNIKEINFYAPYRVGMNRFETFNSDHSFTANTTGNDVYRESNYFDKPFKKTSYKSEYITDFSLGEKQGMPNVVNKQTYTPYNNTKETINKPEYGVFGSSFYYSPWNKNTGQWDESLLYKNYRGQYNVACSNNWFSKQLSLSGDVWNWQTDIYGNHYFCINDDSLNYKNNPTTYNTLFIKLQNGEIYHATDALSSILQSYNNLFFDIH